MSVYLTNEEHIWLPPNKTFEGGCVLVWWGVKRRKNNTGSFARFILWVCILVHWRPCLTALQIRKVWLKFQRQDPASFFSTENSVRFGKSSPRKQESPCVNRKEEDADRIYCNGSSGWNMHCQSAHIFTLFNSWSVSFLVFKFREKNKYP